MLEIADKIHVGESSRLSSDKKDCIRCGNNDHLQNDRKCPALNAKCERCTHFGHYSRMCRTSRATTKENTESQSTSRLHTLRTILKRKISCHEEMRGKENKFSRRFSTDAVVQPKSEQKLQNADVKASKPSITEDHPIKKEKDDISVPQKKRVRFDLEKYAERTLERPRSISDASTIDIALKQQQPENHPEQAKQSSETPNPNSSVMDNAVLAAQPAILSPILSLNSIHASNPLNLPIEYEGTIGELPCKFQTSHNNMVSIMSLPLFRSMRSNRFKCFTSEIFSVEIGGNRYVGQFTAKVKINDKSVMVNFFIENSLQSYAIINKKVAGQLKLYLH